MSEKTIRFSEEDIRPEKWMDRQREAYNRDMAWLLERENRFVHVPCPACAADNTTEKYLKHGFHYVECANCGTLYTNPRPDQALLHEFYARAENYKYWNDVIFPASEEARRESIFKPRAERTAELCKRYGVSGGTMLEVGAGFGTFCVEMKKLNLFDRIFAVEPTPDLAQSCRDRGLEVIESPIEKVDLDLGEVDVIASYETIEHLFDPRGFIADCGKRLRANGLLLLTCPNGRGFDVATLGEHSGTIDGEHLNYFNPDSLALAVNELGFETLEALTPGRLDAELVHKKILSGEFILERQPFLQEILVDRWEELGATFQDFLAENRLSSHLWLVARKIG